MTDEAITIEETVTPALDGHRLATSCFSGNHQNGPVVLVSSGTAIPRQYYRRFAQWLVRRGASQVLTYDYRGIGGSWPAGAGGATKDFHYLMSDWGRLDYPAMVDRLKSEHPDKPLYLIGHSFGGQVFGLSDRNVQADKSVLIASMSGDWRRMAFPDNYKVWFMLSFLAPGVGKIYGYVPGRFGLGEDMGLAAFSQWARWCKKPNYFFDDPTMVETANFTNYRGPLLAIGMADDPWGTPELVSHLVDHFTNAKLERWLISEKEAGGKVGHFGYFRARYEQALWGRLGQWLFS